MTRLECAYLLLLRLVLQRFSDKYQVTRVVFLRGAFANPERSILVVCRDVHEEVIAIVSCRLITKSKDYRSK
jgi:hypothetical protein